MLKISIVFYKFFIYWINLFLCQNSKAFYFYIPYICHILQVFYFSALFWQFANLLACFTSFFLLQYQQLYHANSIMHRINMQKLYEIQCTHIFSSYLGNHFSNVQKLHVCISIEEINSLGDVSICILGIHSLALYISLFYLLYP